MFIAMHNEFKHVLRASQVTARTVVQSDLLCPVCEEDVVFNRTSKHALDAFNHADGSTDCFQSDKESNEHRLAVEVAVETIYNRLTEVTGEPVDIDIERQIGPRSNFVITDIRVASPLRIAAEIFYRTDDLGLRRRINTLSAHGYRTFLIFHSNGTHDLDRINKYLRKMASLDPGHFNPGTMELVLGDLFSRGHLDFSVASEVPRYIYDG
jgi:hypothetical protein